MPVDEQHRRSLPRMPDPQLHLSDVDPLVGETIEHA
jgi:hypothetical protein